MNKIDPISKKQLAFSYGLLLVAGMFFLSSCSSQFGFNRSSIVPAAEATVDVNLSNDGNYELKIKVSNLASPENLDHNHTLYLVWLYSENKGSFNLGVLDVNNKLSGSLETLTPYKPSRIFITAEDAADKIVPGPHVILETEILDID